MAGSPKAFAINSAEGITVQVDDRSEDEKFHLTVFKDGAPVEEHKDLTVDTVGDVQSDHFTVEHIEPPTPEDDPEEGSDGGEG